jgi:hypothetical protein
MTATENKINRGTPRNRRTRKKRKQKPKQLRIDNSKLGVYPKHTHGFSIWGNERVPMTIRVDKELKKQFKTAAKSLFGSTCNPLECVMAAFVGTYKNQLLKGVYPTFTVDIGEIKIERNLRERRKIVGETETETKQDAVRCGFKGCRDKAASKGCYIPKNRVVPLCAKHLDLTVGKSDDWRSA